MEPITAILGLAKFVPEIIRMVSGSDKAAEVADRVVGVAQAITGASTPEAAAEVLNANPEKVLEFKQAMASLDLELTKALLADVQDARRRDTELAKSGIKNVRANVLAASAGLLVVFCLFVIVWVSDLNEFAKGGITLILGRALGWVEQAFSFEFGNTRTNHVKDDTIKNLTK